MNVKITIPIFLLLFTALGCSQLTERSGLSDRNSTAVNSSATDQPGMSGTAATRANPMADIEAAADKFLSEKSFRAKMVAVGDTEVKTDMDYVAPDRFRIKTGNGMETIVIGKDVYVKFGGSYRRMPGAMGNNIPDMREAFNREGRKWFSDARYIGEDSSKGKPALVYEFKNKGKDKLGENDSKLWIGKDDGLPIRLESKFSSGTYKTLAIDYEYDDSVAIEAPAETK